MAKIIIKRYDNPARTTCAIESIDFNGSLIELMQSLDVAGTQVFYNNQSLHDFEENPELKDDDCIEIVQCAEYAVLGYLLYSIISFAISYAVSYVLNKKNRKKDSKASNAPDQSFGLAYSKNDARFLEPVGILLGKTAVTPDLHNQQWVQNVFKNNTLAYTRDIKVTRTNNFAPKTPSWVPLISNPDWLGDNQMFETNSYGQSLVVPSPNYPYNPLLFTYPHSFVFNNDMLSADYGKYAYGYDIYLFDNYAKPIPWFNPIGNEKIIWDEFVDDAPIYDYIHSQQLNAVYNFGFGDVSISNERIQSTLIDDYRDGLVTDGITNAVQTQISSTLIIQYPHLIYAKYPARVVTVNGGDLLNNANVFDSGNIYRDFPDGEISLIAFDVVGQLFYTEDDGSTSSQSVEIKLEVWDNTLSQWVNVTCFLNEDGTGYSTQYPTIILTGKTRNTLRRTVYANVGPQHSKVRIRKITADVDGVRSVEETKVDNIKFFEHPLQTGKCQRLQALTIDAGSQLNGQIEAYNADASMKCWVYTLPAYNDSAVGGVGWVWQETSNPSWLCLYYMLGGYVNETPPASFPDAARGWMNGKHATNKERLFGCGVDERLLDLQSFVDFAQFCDEEAYEFNHFFKQQNSQVEVIDQILDVAQAVLTVRAGKFAVAYESKNNPVVAVFGMSNIIAGSFSITYQGEDEYSEFVGQFNDRENQYALREIKVLAYDTSASYNQRKIELKGITDSTHAGKYVNLVAAKQFYRRRLISFETDMQGSLVSMGDVVKIAHDMTAWGFSGRLVGVTITGANVTQIKLDCKLKPEQSSGVLLLQLPDQTIVTVNYAAITQDTDTLEVTGGFTAAQAPFNVDVTNGAENSASMFYGSDVEDYIWLTGFASAGYRARIKSIEPSSQNRIKIMCEDDPIEMYAHRNGTGLGVPVQSYSTYDYQQTIAECLDVSHEIQSDGILIYFELANSETAALAISINGAPSGVISVYGNSYKMPLQSAGTTVAINVIPSPQIDCFAVRSKSYSFSVPFL